MNKTIIPILIIMLFVSACAHDSVQEEEELDPQHTVIITVPDKIMEEPDGEILSRASLSLSGNYMVYKWDKGDQIGVFNASVSPDKSENKPLTYKSTEGNISRFHNGNFVSSTEFFWIAYAPYACNSNSDATTANRTKIPRYDQISLTYLGQKQRYNATPNGIYPNDATSGYSATTEARATESLHEYDYLISDYSKPQDDGTATHFVFSHVGSTVRFYTRLPEGCFGGAGKSGWLTSLTLVSKTENITTDVSLSINQHSEGNTATYTEKSTTKANNITLDLPGENGKGINLPDHGYFIAYMEFYPVDFPDQTCFLYITAEVDGVKKYFRSKMLPAKNIEAGRLYKWTIGSYDEPIELTATLAPWEDVPGGTINTGE